MKQVMIGRTLAPATMYQPSGIPAALNVNPAAAWG